MLPSRLTRKSTRSKNGLICSVENSYSPPVRQQRLLLEPITQYWSSISESVTSLENLFFKGRRRERKKEPSPAEEDFCSKSCSNEATRLRQKKENERRKLLLHFYFSLCLKESSAAGLFCLSAQYDKSFDRKRKNEAKKNPFFFFSSFSSDPKIYFLYLAPRWPRAHFEARGSTCQKIASFLFSRVRFVRFGSNSSSE